MSPKNLDKMFGNLFIYRSLVGAKLRHQIEIPGGMIIGHGWRKVGAKLAQSWRKHAWEMVGAWLGHGWGMVWAWFGPSWGTVGVFFRFRNNSGSDY